MEKPAKAAKTAKKDFKKYAGKRLNLYLDETLQKIAKEYFPTTRFGSVSGFLEAKLRQVFRAEAPALRKAGIALPDELFTK